MYKPCNEFTSGRRLLTTKVSDTNITSYYLASNYMFTGTVIESGSTCPAGYQAEECRCKEVQCRGAKFVGDTCITETGNVCIYRGYYIFG